jgi:ribosomal protein S18 acetylase RimI-like enzyme
MNAAARSDKTRALNLVLSSKASKSCRATLEELMFFNPRQHRVREGILNSLACFGHPRLVETADGLTVCVADHDAQTLFAYDAGRSIVDPVGVVVFLRTSPTEIAIMHIAVHPDYALQSQSSGLGLGLILMEEIRKIAARIVGIRRVVFFYRREAVLKV